jgi:hypothetical protein
MLILLKITLIGSLLHPESFECSWCGSAKCISAALERANRYLATPSDLFKRKRAIFLNPTLQVMNKLEFTEIAEVGLSVSYQEF